MNRVSVFLRRQRLKKLETWTVRAIIAEAFLIPISPTFAAAAVVFGTITWLLRLKLDGRFKFRSLPFDLPAMLFALIGLASIFGSSEFDFELLRNYCAFVGTYGLTYILVGQNIRRRHQVKAIAIALAASALVVVLWGYFQYIFGIDTVDMRWVDPEKFPELRKRVFSTLENPNVLAGYLDVCICLVLGVLAKVGDRIQRLAMIVAIVMLAACLAMTYARGAYLTIVVVFITYGIIQDWRILLMFMLISGGILYYDAAFVDRLLSIFNSVDSSEGLRIGIWISTFSMIADHPFIGIGWGAFKSVYPSYDYYLKGADVEIYHAHNIFLHQAAEVGIIGAMAFFWYFFGTMFMALELGANKKFVAIRDKILSCIERFSGIGLKRKLVETAGAIKERYLIENGRLERLVRMKERIIDRTAEASEHIIDWFIPGRDNFSTDEDTGKKISLLKRIPLRKKISLKKTHGAKSVITKTVETPTIEDNADEIKIIGEIKAPDRSIVDQNDISDRKGDVEINDRQIADGMKFGIGLAFVSMALNGLTDNLLFNIPTSMLMWMLGALGGAIVLLPDKENTQRRKKFGHEK